MKIPESESNDLKKIFQEMFDPETLLKMSKAFKMLEEDLRNKGFSPFFSDKQETWEILLHEIEGEKIAVTLVTPDMSREEWIEHHNQWGTEIVFEMLDVIVKKHLDKGLYLDQSSVLKIEHLKNKLVMVHWDEFEFNK